MTQIQKDLFDMQDLAYRDFQRKLMPTVDPEKVVGVRTPQHRKYAKETAKLPFDDFIKVLPHTFYEENNLHAFLIETIKDYDRALYETERFLPYIDNWATCDSFVPKVFRKNTQALLPEILKWMKSDRTYTIRYGVGLLMGLYLDENFTPDMPALVAEIQSDEYYVNMMSAWYFATALAKQYDTVIPYLTEKRLSVWVHNKTIQKAVESYRISDETKKYLRGLKIAK